jgi:hypothetical protein
MIWAEIKMARREGGPLASEPKGAPVGATKRSESRRRGTSAIISVFAVAMLAATVALPLKTASLLDV